MLNIGNQVYITIKIDGIPIEYAHIKDMTLAEGNGVFAPTLKIELDDPTSVLSMSHALSEGNPIEVLIGKTMSDSTVKPRKYRVFGPTRDNNSYNPNVVIIGILDCPKYFTASARECTTGTSADAISAIASKVGLKFVGPSNGRVMNDKMTWWDVVTTRARNVQDITRRGYMDDKSGMESVVTSYHELRYKNLADEINTPLGKIEYLFVHSTYQDEKSATGKKTYIVKEARDRSSSGVMASWMNYGSTRSSNNIDGVQRERKKLDVKMPSTDAYLSLNQDVIDATKCVRFDYAEIDCSNTHKYYQDALYQNIKVLGLFSEIMSLLVLEVTDVQLFDPIIYRQADADPLSKVRNEDVYIVIGKTIVVRGGIHYAERIQCIRMSLTMKGEAKLATSMSDTDSAPSIIPESSINQAAIGAGWSNMPKVSNINSTLALINAMNTSLSGMTQSVPGRVLPVLSQLSNLSNVVASGNPTHILSAITGLMGPIASMAGQVSGANSLVSTLPNLTSTLLNSISTMTNAAGNLSSVTGAAASRSGSVFDVISNATKLSTVYGNASMQTSSVLVSLAPQYRQSDSGLAINSTLSSINSMLNMVSATTANSWNSVIEKLTGTALSATQASQLNQLSQQSAGFMIRFAAMMAMPGYTPARMTAFLSQEAYRTSAGQPNWMPVTALVPNTSSAVTDSVAMATIISNVGSKHP